MGWIKYVDTLGAVTFYNMQFVSRIYTDVLFEESLESNLSSSLVSDYSDTVRIPRATRVQMKTPDAIITLARVLQNSNHDTKLYDILKRVEHATKDGFVEIRDEEYLDNPNLLEALVQ